MNNLFRSKSSKKIKQEGDDETPLNSQSESPPSPETPPHSQYKPRVGDISTPYLYNAFDLQMKIKQNKIILDEMYELVNKIIDRANELRLDEIQWQQ